MPTIGVLSDIHGDLAGFLRALAIFARHQVAHVVCAGDSVERGPGADRIVELLGKLGATTVKGNHEHSLLRRHQRQYRSARAERRAQLGLTVSQPTIDAIAALPDSARITIAGVRLLVAHGTPWSDMPRLYADSRQGFYDRILSDYGPSTDVVILGHTHMPMHIRLGHMHILNPGSVYGITGRDSHTCGLLELPGCGFRVVDLHTGGIRSLAQINRKKDAEGCI